SNECLTIHPIGNFSKAELGGKDFELVKCNPFFQKELFLNLNSIVEKENFAFPVILEQTHHGPFLSKPTVFIEIGSTIKEWSNEKACEIIAETIVKTIKERNFDSSSFPVALGCGGLHYCHELTKVEANSNIALSHIMSKMVIEKLDFEGFEKAVNASTVKPELVVIDWKGTNALHREKVLEFSGKLGLPFKKSKTILK
ncbi:MAG: D-aminoacyl-tRNA deacylase, partial [archaeon]